MAPGYVPPPTTPPPPRALISPRHTPGDTATGGPSTGALRARVPRCVTHIEAHDAWSLASTCHQIQKANKTSCMCWHTIQVGVGYIKTYCGGRLEISADGIGSCLPRFYTPSFPLWLSVLSDRFKKPNEILDWLEVTVDWNAVWGGCGGGGVMHAVIKHVILILLLLATTTYKNIPLNIVFLKWNICISNRALKRSDIDITRPQSHTFSEASREKDVCCIALLCVSIH